MAALTSGNIFVPSDNFDFTKGDAAEISASTGALVQTVAFARATKGDILPSGIFCLAVESGTSTLLSSISIYSADGTTVLAAITTWTVGSRSALCPIYAWGSSHFFVMIPKNAGDPFVTLHKISVSGSVVQSWNLPANANFADNLGISPDGNTAYYCFDQTNTPIYSYNLATSTANANLVAALSGRHWSKNIVVDASGNVLVPMYDNSTYPQSYVHKYSPAGSLLDTFDIGDTNGEVPEIFTDPDPAYVWVRNFPLFDGSISTFFRFLIADGSISRTFTVDTLDGTGQIPSTCPNLILRSEPASVVLPPATPTPPTPGTCEPQAPVSGGGIGNSGCNVGGVGRDPVIFDEYGHVPAHADPTPGELLTGKVGIDLWVAWHHIEYPAGTTTTIRRAMVELADLDTYHGGRKQAALLEVGEFEHGLGNEYGGFEAADCTFRFSDAFDRWIRTQLEDQELEGDEVEFYLASPAARAAGTEPRVLMRGIVQSTTLESPLTASITAVDALFSLFGPFGSRPHWPFWTIGDLFPEAPADVKVRALPVLYGSKTDAGAVDPVTSEPREKGLVPWHFVGQLRVSGTAEPGALLPTSADDAVGEVDEVGTLGGPGDWIEGTKPRIAVARVVDGVMGPLVDAPGATPAPPETVSGARHVWNDAGPADYYIDFAVPYTVPTDWHPLSNPYTGSNVRYQIVSATASNPYPDWQFVAFWASENDGLSWDDRNTVTPADGALWDAYVVVHGASYEGGQVFGSDLGGGDPANKHDRTALDMATQNGSDILWPWNADGTTATAWPLANTYVDVIGGDGETYRLTMGFARGAISEDHKNGVVNITCNMWAGVEDVGDGSGLPIVAAHDVEQHWIENYLLLGYRSGLWCTNTTAPKWPDGTYKVRSTRFYNRQLYTVDALGGIGLESAWYVGDQKALPEHFRDWNDATETTLGTNGFGQVSLGYLDETLDTSTWPRFDHVTDIFGPVRASYGVNRENCGAFSCDWDPDAQKYRIGPISLTNDPAIEKYKGKRKSGSPIESPILYDETHLRWIAQKRLARLGTGVITVDMAGRVDLLDHDVDDDGIILTTIEGRGASGYVDQPMLIRRRGFSLATGLARYTLHDVADVLLSSRFVDGLTRQALITDDNDDAAVVSDDDDVAPLVLL